MKIQKLTKTIDQQMILAGIDFELPLGEIVGLIGRNGSGKTTLFRTISGYYLADSGEVEIDGQKLSADPALREQIFYIDEMDNILKPYSLAKLGRFYRDLYPNFDFDRFIELVTKQELPIKRSYRSMSKGMQGLFQMILALCSNAPYMILDEPFDGLDVIVRKNVIRLLLESMADGKRTAIISSHNLKELENLVDRVLILKENKIQQDYLLEELREQSRKIQLVLKNKKIPAFIKENSKLLQLQGRVLVVVFDHYTKELEEQIRQLEPLIFEELPLTLEDVFEANLKKQSDDVI